MIEPLTRIILEAFEDLPIRTYDELMTRAMSIIGDETRTQIYLEITRLTGLGALEIVDADEDMGETYRVTPIGKRFRDHVPEPDRARPEAEPDPPKKRRPTPRDWEW